MDQETTIALLLERVENLKSQQARMVSHLESEQRVSVEQGKRIDDGLRRLDHIERELDRRDKDSRYKIYFWFSIASLVISVLAIFLKK